MQNRLPQRTKMKKKNPKKSVEYTYSQLSELVEKFISRDQFLMMSALDLAADFNPTQMSEQYFFLRIQIDLEKACWVLIYHDKVNRKLFFFDPEGLPMDKFSYAWFVSQNLGTSEFHFCHSWLVYSQYNSAAEHNKTGVMCVELAKMIQSGVQFDMLPIPEETISMGLWSRRQKQCYHFNLVLPSHDVRVTPLRNLLVSYPLKTAAHLAELREHALLQIIASQSNEPTPLTELESPPEGAAPPEPIAAAESVSAALLMFAPVPEFTPLKELPQMQELSAAPELDPLYVAPGHSQPIASDVFFFTPKTVSPLQITLESHRQGGYLQISNEEIATIIKTVSTNDRLELLVALDHFSMCNDFLQGTVLIQYIKDHIDQILTTVCPIKPALRHYSEILKISEDDIDRINEVATKEQKDFIVRICSNLLMGKNQGITIATLRELVTDLLKKDSFYFSMTS